MPLTILSVSQAEATTVTQAIVAKASEDGGQPVAVSVVDCAGRLVAFIAMDGVMPACIKLSQNKAYSAVVGKQDTIKWTQRRKNAELLDFDMRNWTDENFTGFTGGVVLLHDGQIIGGVAVSGRKGAKEEGDRIMQDNELADYGRTIYNQINHATWMPKTA